MTYKTRQFLGGDRRGETPVPIPNTVVKPSTADGTCLKRGRESMKLPGLISSRAVARRINGRINLIRPFCFPKFSR